MLIVLSVTSACGVQEAPAEAKPAPVGAAERGLPELEARYGVEIEGIRLSAGGYMLDFRYRVLDPDKAAALTDHDGEHKPYLHDQASGARLFVPAPAKVGPLQATGMPKPGRTYFVLFANPGRLVKPGGKVDINIGDFQARDLVVE